MGTHNHSSALSQIKLEASRCIQGGKLSKAIELLSRVCKDDSSDTVAWLMLAEVNARMDRLEDVIHCCTMVTNIQPDNIAAHLNCGIAQQTLEQHGYAAISYRRVLELEPTNVNALNNLGGVLWKLNEVDGAETVYRKAISYQPDHATAHFNLGLVLKYKNKKIPAITCFKEAINLQPNYVEPNMELGNHYTAENMYGQAEAHYRHVIKFNPHFVMGLFQLANTLYLQKKYEESTSYYNQVLQIDPKHAGSCNNLGRLFEETGKLEEAVRYFKRGLEHTGSPGVYHRNLGRVYRSLARQEKSVREYQLAIGVEPGNSENHSGLGQSLFEIGRFDEGYRSCMQALKIDPSNSDAIYFLKAAGSACPSSIENHEFVSEIFDGCAESFDKILIEHLGYKLPNAINSHVRTLINTDENSLDILDLGCGTGLCGSLLKDTARTVTGIDLSRKMITQSKLTHAYTKLINGDITKETLKLKLKFDLIIAADVFIYVGNLKYLFPACQSAIKNRGYFIFSTERTDTCDFALLSSGRFAHSDQYIKELSLEFGFKVVRQHRSTLRMEKKLPIQGTIHTLQAG